MKTAKTIFLSKDENGSQFPKVGDVRIIAVLPAITKLYELVLHEKLLADINARAPLHPHQRGFVAGKGCLNNLADVLHVMQEAQKDISQAIQLKIPPKKRCNHYLLFIDLRKAFDSISRRLLLQ